MTTTWTGCAWTPCTPSRITGRCTCSRSWPWRSQALGTLLNRELVLIAESDLNDPRLVSSREAGGFGLAAQWSDDFHHAVHAAVTGERQGYYGDFGSIGALVKTLTRVYFHDGNYSSFRGRAHGRPVDLLRIPGFRFLGYLQDHDQIGNRATGDRISSAAVHRPGSRWPRAWC